MPAHQNIEASTVAGKIWKRLDNGTLTHPSSSQFAQKALVALGKAFSTATSKLLSKVIRVPSTLKLCPNIGFYVNDDAHPHRVLFLCAPRQFFRRCQPTNFTQESKPLARHGAQHLRRGRD